MTIPLPQVQVFQTFRSSPAELTDPLRAFIFGPEYKLHRYTVAAEKVKSGTYDPFIGNSFSWLDDLDRQAGALIDLNYSKVHIEDALFEYWSDAAASQFSSINGSFNASDGNAVCRTPLNAKNKIKFNAVNLVDKAGYALDALFYGRNVAVGDYLSATITLDGVEYTSGGNIIGFEAEAIAATIGTAASADSNQATQAAVGAAYTNVVGAIPLVLAGSYSGIKLGNLSETYTIEVIRGTTNQNPSTAVLNITSASGDDDVIGYRPTSTTYGTAIPLGANGLTFRFNPSPSTTDLTVGMIWTVTVSQVFTKPTATSAGTYTGVNDTTYVLTVVRGGTIGAVADADKPTVAVTTTTGVDNAPAALVASGAFTVGNFGVTATWSQNVLCAGDQYYIQVVAEALGAIRTAVIDTSLPTQMITTSESNVRDLTVTLNIKKNVELPTELFALSLTNWEQDSDTISLLAGARDYDSTWRDGEYDLPLMGGSIYIHWRELITSHSDRVYEIATNADLDSIFTTQNDPDNPLVYGVKKALANSGTETAPGTGIRVMAVPTDDLAGYTHVLNISEGRQDLYAMVPLTFDPAVHLEVAAHVTNQSTPDNGSWRIAFICSQEFNPEPWSVANDNGATLLATTTSDKFLDLAVGSTAQFLTDSVRSGDTVRIGYATDVYGKSTYSEYKIDFVVSETRLKLVTAPSTPVGTPSKVEIWRTNTANDAVDQMGGKAGAFASRRVYNVYPATLKAGGVDVAGYFGCAAVAGLVGASVPQQGLTNVQIKGFDSARNVLDRFNRSQLDRMANFGVWIITQDIRSGQLYTRHQLSTDVEDLNTRELSVVKNVDAISYFFLNRLRPYIGRANVTPTMVEILRTQIESGISYLQSAGFDPRIGGQVLEGTVIRELSVHPLLKDRVVVVIDLVIPYPLNNIELYLTI